MTDVLPTAAYFWGRAVASYTLALARPARSTIEGLEKVPPEPAIYVAWHETNVLSSGLIPAFGMRSRFSFVPEGLVGSAMRGWLTEIGQIETVPISENGTGGLRGALTSAAKALERGTDVIIAGDGPSGPARRLRPGAVWLARTTGCPIVLIGYAARPAVRLPRWDRLVVPLPGARFAAVVADLARVDRTQKVDEALLASLGTRLNDATSRAQKLVS